MERPEDAEWCCGAICDSHRKLNYINFLENRIKYLESALKTQTEDDLYEKEVSQ